MNKCLMCKDKTCNWLQVLKLTCGMDHKESMEVLCNDHKIVFANQCEQHIGKSIVTKDILE